MGYLLFINKSHQRVAFIGNSYVCYILAQFHSVPLIVLSNLHGSGVSHLSLKKLARICLFSSAMPPWAMHLSTPFIHMCISYYSKVSQQRESFFWACGDGLSSPKSVSSFFAFWYARDRPAAVWCKRKKILRYHFGHYTGVGALLTSGWLWSKNSFFLHPALLTERNCKGCENRNLILLILVVFSVV